MDEDNPSIPETQKLGIRASPLPAPEPHAEPPFSVRSETGSPNDEDDRRVYDYLGDRLERLTLPGKIHVGQEFEETTQKIRLTLTGVAKPSSGEDKFAGSMYYLLGMLVGDAHRAFSTRHPLEARVELDLCRAHPENLALGQFVALCE